jgi:hypothetical protein
MSDEVFEDLVRGLRPDGGFRVFVPSLCPVAEVFLQGLDVLVDPSPYLLIVSSADHR